MVSTRQSSNIGSGSSSGRVNESVDPGSSRRHQTHHNHATQNAQTSSSSSPEPVTTRNCNLLDLPTELIDKITTYLDFNTVANLRLVCHQINTICASRLSSTFQRLQSQMLSRFQTIKSQMPRRESARRNHPLACECDIIETLHMRLTLLQMSFGKHIERKHCCFFPGEILDEVYRILHYIKITPKLTKPYKVTDELFDLTTMAMEYFKERIEPTLPEISYFGPDFLDIGTFSSSSSTSKPFACLDSTPMSGDTSKDTGSGGECSPRHSNEDSCLVDSNVSLPQSNMFLRRRIRRIKQGMKRYNCQLSLVRRDLRNCKTKIAEQQKQILEYANRLDDNVKKNEETSRKFSTLLQELNKCKTELQYWRSKSPAISVCNGCGQSMPMPAEGAFSNQRVISETFASLNFIPIGDADSSIDDSEQSTSTLPSPLPIQQPLSQSPSSSSASSSSSTSSLSSSSLSSSSTTSTTSSSSQSDMAPPKGPGPAFASKRKFSDNSLSTDSTKKLRRNAKSRHVKRAKV